MSSSYDNQTYVPKPNADLNTKLRCALFSHVFAPGFSAAAMNRLNPIPPEKFFRLVDKNDNLTILRKLELPGIPDYVSTSVEGAKMLKLEIENGSKWDNHRWKLAISANIWVLDDNNKVLTTTTHVQVNFSTEGDRWEESVRPHCNWEGVVNLLKRGIVSKFDLYGQFKPNSQEPWLLFPGDAMIRRLY